MDICDTCYNFVYDDEMECYICEADLDEDDMARFMSHTYKDCPFYRNGDEYKIVRKQM